MRSFGFIRNPTDSRHSCTASLITHNSALVSASASPSSQ